MNDHRMTVRELAVQFGGSIHTITNYANKLFSDKLRNGIKTYFSEQEATLILDSIKHGKGDSPTAKTLYEVIQGMETALTPVLKLTQLTELIEKSHREIEAIKDAEIARLRFRVKQERIKKDQERQAKEAVQIRLSEHEEWYSVKRVLIETGKEYFWKPLKKYSRRHGYTVQKTFDKNYGEVNAYHQDVWNAVYGLEL
ncbi:MAG: hypothetical protein LBR79_00530 [Oscillospiraceae bacterium]|nr:hypothetical protein [Oscillospiraceae bacterium]